MIAEGNCAEGTVEEDSREEDEVDVVKEESAEYQAPG